MYSKVIILLLAATGAGQARWLEVADGFRAPSVVTVDSSLRVRLPHTNFAASPSNSTRGEELMEQKKWSNKTVNCTAEPKGFGPVPLIDSPGAWLNLTSMAQTAKAAQVPKGFLSVANGRALNGAVEAVGFEGFAYLEKYDVDQCASWCMEKRECISFNIYYERDPIYSPADACPDPKSTTTIKCVFWGNELDAGLATNHGEMRKDFQVLIAGSNLYTKLNPGANLTSFGFHGPRTPRVKAVFEPPFEPTGHYNTTLGFQTYPYRLGFYYNPEVCARACNERTERNAQDKSHSAAHYTNGGYDKCNTFTAFELHKNGVPHAMVCVDYASAWDNIYGTWTGEISEKGEAYSPKLVEVYTRSDYTYKPICADKESCGDRYYAGGDCSGWGEGHCSVQQRQEYQLMEDHVGEAASAE